MAETVQSLEGLATLKPAAPEAPKYEKKVDAQGRAYATGKRKNAVARVWIKPGSGKILVNTKSVEVFFARPVLRMLIQQPLVATNRNGQYDVTCTVSGGGLSGQAGAVRHGLAKALTYFEPDLRGALKRGGFLTRDSRVVERKKYGRAKARRSQARRLPDTRPTRRRAQEIWSRQGSAFLPVLEALNGLTVEIVVKGAQKARLCFAVRDRSNCNYFICTAFIAKMHGSRGNEPQV